MRAQVSTIAIVAVIIILVGVGIFTALRITMPPSVSGFEDVELALGECIDVELDELVPLAASHGGELAYSIDANHDVARSVRDDQSRLVPLWTEFTGSGDPLVYRPPKLHPRDDLGGGIALSIEEQFELFLNERLASCLERSAHGLGVAASVSDVSTDVTVGDRIRVTALAIGSFEREGRSASRLLAQRDRESSFHELFVLAREVSSFDALTGFFAAYIEDIIVLGSGVDERYPPMYEFDFAYATRLWTAHGVEQALASDLDTALPLIQFSSSYTPADPPYLVRRGLLDFERRGAPVGEDTFISVSRAAPPTVSFDSGRITSGEPLLSAVPILGDLIPVREYRTRYDVSVPLIITLTSRSDGLRFRFAVEPRIDNNRILRAGAGSLSADTTDMARAREAFCREPTGAEVSVGLSGADPDETTLTYRCGAISCSYPYEPLITLPACIGGELVAHAPDVRFGSVRIDSSDPYASVSLHARSRVDVDVDGGLVRTDPVKTDNRASELTLRGSRSIGDSERMIAVFTGLDTDHAASVIIGSDPVSVPLYEGVYEVSVTVMRDLEAHVMIPARNECVARFLFCLARQQIDPIRLEDMLLLGQFERLGPVFINPSSSQVRIEVPIFDLEAIAEEDRVVEDLEFYDVLERSVSGSEVMVS